MVCEFSALSGYLGSGDCGPCAPGEKAYLEEALLYTEKEKGRGGAEGRLIDGEAQNKTAGFSISVFGWFAYILSALYGHCPGNLRPKQTECTRTAGHRISEKPKSGFRRDPAELPEVVRGVDGRLWGFGF